MQIRIDIEKLALKTQMASAKDILCFLNKLISNFGGRFNTKQQNCKLII